ncbi:MAG: hypothetical protein JJ878_09225 [Alphaproteobacteria bacterium]|nr:hypothetical protein [Alphaproteobacteria bacterium]MBO6862807.1 hypothetical protein [Alphaproteobacteria bacterium]
MEVSLIPFANAAISWFLLLGLIVMVSGPMRSLVLDYYRQKIYELRDELFDMAHHGEIDFNDPIYREVRAGLHRMIRVLHLVTVPNLITIMLLRVRRNRLRKILHNPMRRAIASTSDPELREKLEALEQLSVRFALRSAILRSPLTAVLAIAVLFCMHMGSDWKRSLRTPARTLQVNADHYVAEN